MNGPLKQVRKYTDGRTKQCFKNECDIVKIMARADKAGSISHLEKFQGVYADYSDVDFHTMTTQLTKGREIFDELPAELRQEFGQSPAKFFAYVNDPANIDELRKKLPGLAEPGRQLNQTVAPMADEEAVITAASEPVASDKPIPTTVVAATTPGPKKAPTEPPAIPAEQ
jgi:hypothetical protein